MPAPKQKGGILGVFRQGTAEGSRMMFVNYPDAETNYEMKTMIGKVIATKTGKELQTFGFSVSLNGLYDSELFEISATHNNSPSSFTRRPCISLPFLNRKKS